MNFQAVAPPERKYLVWSCLSAFSRCGLRRASTLYLALSVHSCNFSFFVSAVHVWQLVSQTSIHARVDTAVRTRFLMRRLLRLIQLHQRTRHACRAGWCGRRAFAGSARHHTLVCVGQHAHPALSAALGGVAASCARHHAHSWGRR